MKYQVSDPNGGEAWMETRSPERAAEAYADSLAYDCELRHDQTVRLRVMSPDGAVTYWDATCQMHPEIDVVEVDSESESDA